MLKVGGILSQEEFNGGLNTLSDPFSLQPSESPRVVNVNFNEDASLEKRQGREKLNTTVTGATDSCNGLFDFGISSGVRKVIGQFGTSVYKMDDLDGTWDSILSSRNNCLNYFDRIAGYLVNSTDDREILKYWNGTDASMVTLNDDAPNVKFIGEFNGYMLAMNTSSNARRIYYELTSTMFTGDWGDYFTLPSSSDDEIMWGVELRGRYYVSLKNSWYRLSYISGDAVFDYKLTSSTVGAVPRTAKVVTIPNVGEVIMYLGWDKKVRIFDGTTATPISLKYEKSNNDSNIYLENINQAQLRYCHSKVDTVNSIFHLFISNGDSGTINVRLDINYKTLACSPHTNQDILSAVMAEDISGKKYLIGGDYNGTAYILNRGNIDEVPLNNVEHGADGSLASIETYVVKGGGVCQNKVHDGGNNSDFAQDTSENFTTLGVTVGDLIRNKDDQCQGIITAIGNGGGTNDKLTIAGGLTGGTDNDFDNDDIFNVYKACHLAYQNSIYIGSKVKFDAIVIDLQQFGNVTIVPAIYYSSDAVGGYTLMSASSNDLSDGTNGFLNSGVITFTPPSGWTATAKDDGGNNFNDTTTYYYIKIQRYKGDDLTRTPQLNKINIGLRIDDIYNSPKLYGKRLADVKKPQKIDFYFEPKGNYNVKFYDRIDYQRNWEEGSKRPLNVPQFNQNDDFLGKFKLGTDLLGSHRTLIKHSIEAQGINNCYQYYITSNKSYLEGWKLYKVDLGESVLGVGDSRPLVRV